VSARLHLCTAEDIEKLLPLVAARHAESEIMQSEAARRAALMPLLEGSPHGAVYLIGPRQAPVGYAVLSFGWSVIHGGVAGSFAEFWIRPALRGKGMQGEALTALVAAFQGGAVKALTLEADAGSDAERVFARAGFTAHAGRVAMTRRISRP